MTEEKLSWYDLFVGLLVLLLAVALLVGAISQSPEDRRIENMTVKELRQILKETNGSK